MSDIKYGQLPDDYWDATNKDEPTESLRKQVKELETVPMKYRLMEFNAQLQNENDRLKAELAAHKQSQGEPVYYEITLSDGTRFVAANRSILEGAKSKPLYTTPIIPEGWETVIKMLVDGCAALLDSDNCAEHPAYEDCLAGLKAYRDMLAAAPKPKEQNQLRANIWELPKSEDVK